MNQYDNHDEMQLHNEKLYHEEELNKESLRINGVTKKSVMFIFMVAVAGIIILIFAKNLLVILGVGLIGVAALGLIKAVEFNGNKSQYYWSLKKTLNDIEQQIKFRESIRNRAKKKDDTEQ